MLVPPTQPLNLDVEAISGICGSISIACWVVVFTPQILQNFRRSSTDGLSIQFIIVWLAGDVFNIIGGLLQNILPTMIILAIYYTIADMVLLGQCFYYRGFTWRDDIPAKPTTATPADASERTRLLDTADRPTAAPHDHTHPDWTNLSPAVPLVSDDEPLPPPPSVVQSLLFNLLAVVMVIAAGFLGWFLSARTGAAAPPSGDLPPVSGPAAPPALNFWGQVFGYLCAALYILSRLPQLVLNYRRKSTDGLSMLFFLFACLGNVTYVLSVLAYDPQCEGHKGDGVCRPGEAWAVYGRYILVNASWLAGSSLTLVLDFCVFVQYFMYDVVRKEDEEECATLAN
ncbi:hypothetical protein TD95_004652 [Thielaviopsis punctulata]|uniref:Uncharacterized protein n=1 Tax=Thielaviopsis punctulata TaxID=72032 RepID=A0A0F4ZJS1_9PEZI|nr:hypothetical protein TD95_004652 [Thielaviopsis punctulata]